MRRPCEASSTPSGSTRPLAWSKWNPAPTGWAPGGKLGSVMGVSFMVWWAGRAQPTDIGTVTGDFSPEHDNASGSAELAESYGLGQARELLEHVGADLGRDVGEH